KTQLPVAEILIALRTGSGMFSPTKSAAWFQSSVRSSLLRVMRKGVAAGVVALLGAPEALAADRVASAYSRFHYENCTRTGDDEPIMERRCEGYDGIPVHWVNEPDSS